MSDYTNFNAVYLCNVNDCKSFMKSSDPSGSSWDDSYLLSFIAQASADFTGELSRLALPYSAVFKADYSKAYVDYRSRVLNLYPHTDLLSVSSVLNGNSQTISSSYYTVDPANGYPKTEITLKWNAPVRWQGDGSGNYQQVIQVTGIFGYVPHYPNAWKNQTTLGALLDDSSTSVTLTSATNLYAGDYIQVDSETMLIESITGTTATVERGALGTGAASHSNGATVKRFDQRRDIRYAVREWASYLYLTKDKVGEDITTYEGVVTAPRGLSPTVINAVLRNRKKDLGGLN